MSAEKPNGDREEQALWKASRQYMGGESSGHEYQQAQQPSRENFRRAVLGHARKMTREQIIRPIKRLGKLLKRG